MDPVPLAVEYNVLLAVNFVAYPFILMTQRNSHRCVKPFTLLCWLFFCSELLVGCALLGSYIVSHPSVLQGDGFRNLMWFLTVGTIGQLSLFVGPLSILAIPLLPIVFLLLVIGIPLFLLDKILSMLVYGIDAMWYLDDSYGHDPPSVLGIAKF
ncbi:Hypothetical protein POVN_LOCUS129 [uncultured virus]|nr:Hypothetical protein POVN_LOCUS129 [uncultured virus]